MSNSFFFKLTLSAILILHISSCKEDESTAETYPDFLKVKLPIHRSSPVGDWGSTIFMYSCRLSIRSNHTFSFVDQSCLGSSFSEGTWSRTGLNILLNSTRHH